MTGTRRRGAKTLWRIYVPTELAAELELYLADPLRDKPTYGARSQLITQLLEDFLSNVKKGAINHDNH